MEFISAIGRGHPGLGANLSQGAIMLPINTLGSQSHVFVLGEKTEAPRVNSQRMGRTCELHIHRVKAEIEPETPEM